jgi:hypothetical protein
MRGSVGVYAQPREARCVLDAPWVAQCGPVAGLRCAFEVGFLWSVRDVSPRVKRWAGLSGLVQIVAQNKNNEALNRTQVQRGHGSSFQAKSSRVQR